MSRRSIGKSGGENEREIRSRRLRTGEGGPQMSIAARSSQSGEKNLSPSRWSRCRCVRSTWIRRVPRSASSKPSCRIPVPASRTSTLPSGSETSTQDVFPPYPTVSCPGVGTEPRQPQIATRIAALLALAPEDRHDADELVRMREERERGHGNLAVDAVPSG